MRELDFAPHSLICFPIHNAHKIIVGALQVITQVQHPDAITGGQIFTDIEKDRLEHLCVVVGSAVWNLYLSKERQTAQNRIEILLKLNKSIAVERNSPAVLERILEVSYELLHCEQVGLFEKLLGENDLYITHATDKAKGQYISIDSGIVGLVARTGASELYEPSLNDLFLLCLHPQVS